MMKILVTGADGQLGRHLRWAAADSADCYCFTDCAELDITNREAVHRYVSDEQVDIIVNCAAYTDVERAETEEEWAYTLNAKAVGYLAEAAKEHDALLIHISTDYVFMGGCCAMLTEHSQPHPINAYGRTKLAGEEVVRASGCHYIILRTAWLYARDGHNFVQTILRRGGAGERLRVVNDQIGSPTYAGDLAEAIVQIITRRQFVEGLYHYTNLGECSWWEFAVAICCEGECRAEVEPCSSEEYPTKARRPKNTVLDKTKFQTTFQQQIPHWRESLKKCLHEL